MCVARAAGTKFACACLHLLLGRCVPTFLPGLQAYLSAAPRALLPLDNNIALPDKLSTTCAITRLTLWLLSQKLAFDMASRFDIRWRENEVGAFPCQTLPVDIADFEKILEHQNTAEDGLNRSLALLENIPGTELAAQQIRLELAKVRQSVEAVGTHIKQVWNMVPLLMWPTDGAAAEKVFKTPELLEEILIHLPTRTKLNCMAVQRRWYDAVNDSVRLRRSLGLEPSTNPFYYTAFDDTWCLGRKGRLDSSFPYNWLLEEEDHPYPANQDRDWADEEVRLSQYDASKVLLRGTFLVSHANLRTFGSRVRAMRIASPAIRDLEVSFSCCSGWGGCNAHHTPEVLHAPTPEGFTAGSLHEAVTGYFEKHQASCDWTNCRPSSVPIHVFITIYLHEDDPIYIERREAKAKRLEWCAEQREEEMRVEAELEDRARAERHPLEQDDVRSVVSDAASGNEGYWGTVQDTEADSTQYSDGGDFISVGWTSNDHSDADETPFTGWPQEDDSVIYDQYEETADADDAESWGGEIVHDAETPSEIPGQGW